MNLGALIKGMMALRVPQATHDANGDHIGLSSGGKNIPLAMVYAFPSTPQVYTSPIAGDQNLAAEELLHGVYHLGTGFLMPKAGILTEIGVITQGSTGAGTARNLRYNVVTIENDNTADSGFKVGANLLSGLTTLADNFNGAVTVAAGLNIAVPSQFMIFLKTPLNYTTGSMAQAVMSAGPVPGVVGFRSGATLLSTTTYVPATMDTDTITPRVLVAGEKITIDTAKGIAVYIKWKGQ